MIFTRVPEPATWLLVLAGLAAALVATRLRAALAAVDRRRSS
jgi:hypothetical protein